jgi:hypothetical protein
MPLVCATFLTLALPLHAEEDRYDYCRDKAQAVSGYFGAVPAEYRRKGGAIQGALKGAAAGVALGWVTGGDKKKAAKRGAALGLLFGGLKMAGEDKKRKENAEKRRRYEVELHACMSD